MTKIHYQRKREHLPLCGLKIGRAFFRGAFVVRTNATCKNCMRIVRST